MGWRSLWTGLLSLLVLWSEGGPARGARPCSIIVNFGPYPSAEQAASSEGRVNWRDLDVSDDTICTEAFAACELQRYLQKMTGQEFPLLDDDEAPPPGDLILIGGPTSNKAARTLAPLLGIRRTDLQGLGPEGYLLQSAPLQGRRALLIAGGSRVGTLYGVYDFLHRLGVRWYAPGEANEEVPRRPWDGLPELDIREEPAFLLRGFHAWEDRGDEDFLLWMARNRLNYWCVEQSQKPLLHKVGILLAGGGHILTFRYLNPKAPYPYDHPLFIGDEGKPQDPYPLSPDYRSDANKDGVLSYFEAHPEWYGLHGGKRSDNIRGDGGDNFCTSNEGALREWMKNAIADLAEGNYRDADIINAWTLDGGRWCECPSCIALGTPTDRNLLLVHRFAQEIKKAQAEGRVQRRVRLLFLVYADVLAPPTRPLPKDFDYEMCIATFFPIVRCYVHTLDDPRCPTNSRYHQALHKWAFDPDRHYRGQICIGEYYNVSGYKCLPLCLMTTMRHDIPYYHRLGARYFHYMHVTTCNWGNKALTNWQMARQLWDPQTDCEALWRDYFEGRYGPAGPLMRRFYEGLERMLSNVSELKYGLARRLNAGAPDLFPTAHLRYDLKDPREKTGPTLVEILEYAARCWEILGRVKAMPLPERIARRVEEDERLFTYGERTVKFYDALCRVHFALQRGNRPQAQKALEEARALAELLRADTTSTQFSSSHANAPNALVASFAADALERFAGWIEKLPQEGGKYRGGKDDE